MRRTGYKVTTSWLRSLYVGGADEVAEICMFSWQVVGVSDNFCLAMSIPHRE